MSSRSASRRVASPGFRNSPATFDLQPPSSLLKLNESAREVEYWIEKILRVKESSLDPLSRSFLYSLEFLVLPHSSLLLLPIMQTRSRSRAVATPRQPQSTAALLPEEILDSIFTQFGFSSSIDPRQGERTERQNNLSNMSVVAEGWMKPARRLLFRSVRIEDWVHLTEGVEEGVGNQVRELEIHGLDWDGAIAMRGEAASAVSKLLERLPNLRRLRLEHLPFDSFNPTDSTSMQSTILLPLLHDLSIDGELAPSIIFDLLATSNHQINRLSVHCYKVANRRDRSHQLIDFCGNLRHLSVDQESYEMLLNPQQVVLEGLVGLCELDRSHTTVGHAQQERELARVIAPTLRTLSIASGSVEGLANFLPLFPSLSRLSIRHDGSRTPLLQRLPPSLSFLQLSYDHQLETSLVRWTADPTLVPVGLARILFINGIHEPTTFERLPRIETLSTTFHLMMIGLLGRLAPGNLPFKILEVRFNDGYLNSLGLVQAECARLGVEFRQRIEPWDD